MKDIAAVLKMDNECGCLSECGMGEKCCKSSEFVIVINTYDNIQIAFIEGGISICRNKNRVVELENNISLYDHYDIDTHIIEIGKESYLVVAIIQNYYSDGEDKKIITELFSSAFKEGIYYYGQRFTVKDFILYVGRERVTGHTTIMSADGHFNVFIENVWTAEIDINTIETLVFTEMPGGRIIFGHNSRYNMLSISHMHCIQNTYHI